MPRTVPGRSAVIPGAHVPGGAEVGIAQLQLIMLRGQGIAVHGSKLYAGDVDVACYLSGEDINGELPRPWLQSVAGREDDGRGEDDGCGIWSAVAKRTIKMV